MKTVTDPMLLQQDGLGLEAEWPRDGGVIDVDDLQFGGKNSAQKNTAHESRARRFVSNSDH
ncbi:MAG TPA: hypothetical protein VGK24_21425 [Candidatus Angelobacter sp.]